MKNQLLSIPHLPDHVETEDASSKILIVDDHPVNQMVMQKMLSNLCYSADVASSGKEALDALRQRPYDIVFMDIMMPEMDGITATQRIIELYPDTERPVVIGVTAHDSFSVREHCLQVGMDDFFTKPIYRAQLASILSKYDSPRLTNAVRSNPQIDSLHQHCASHLAV